MGVVQIGVDEMGVDEVGIDHILTVQLLECCYCIIR